VIVAVHPSITDTAPADPEVTETETKES